MPVCLSVGHVCLQEWTKMSSGPFDRPVITDRAAALELDQCQLPPPLPTLHQSPSLSPNPLHSECIRTLPLPTLQFPIFLVKNVSFGYVYRLHIERFVNLKTLVK